jgi:hypothetical protein
MSIVIVAIAEYEKEDARNRSELQRPFRAADGLTRVPHRELGVLPRTLASPLSVAEVRARLRSRSRLEETFFQP